MREVICGAMLTMMSIFQTVYAAEVTGAAPEQSGAISLSHLLERVAERLHKRFIIDPRVRAEVTLIGIDPERITYHELQAVLSVHGFVATHERNGIIEILPDAIARQLPMPILSGRDSNVDDEDLVTKTFDVAPLQATQLVPILRPLLPQYAHLVGDAQTNTLIVVARYANVRMLEAVIRDLQKRPVQSSKEATSH